MPTLSSALPQGELSLLAGASGAGKSTLCLQLFAGWTSSTPTLGFDPPASPAPLYYLAADRSSRSLHEVAQRLRWDLTPHLISLVDDPSIPLPILKTDPFGLLLTILSRHPGPALWVIDPIMIFLGCDLNRYNLVAPQLIQLNRHCTIHSLTILGIHHTVKSRSDFTFLRPQDRLSGSSALSAFTSTQWALWSSEELPQAAREAGLTRLDLISHTSAPSTHWFKRGENGLFVLAAPSLPSRSRTADAILTRLASGPASTKDLLLLSSSRATIYRALNDLLSAGLVTQPSPGVWAS